MIIDISHYQNVTDWNKVKQAVDMVVIKATQGHALKSDSYLFTDRAFHDYIKAAIAVGIPIGVYHFFTGSTLAEAAAEAEYLLKVIQPYKKHIKLVACDAENYGNKYLLGLSRNELSNYISAFCRRVEMEGYKLCHYTNTDHIRSYINLGSIPYPVWQADYITKTKPATPNLIAWQHTDKGRIPGIANYVDLNEGYIDIPAVAVPEAPQKHAGAIEGGDKVTILPGAKYTNGAPVPPRLIGTTQTVTSVNSAGAYIGAIFSRIPISGLEKV